MKIIRLIPNNNYGPFPERLILVSEVNFKPAIGITYKFFTMDGQRWDHLCKPSKVYVGVAYKEMLKKEEERFYFYKYRKYCFTYEPGGFTLT